MEKDRTAAYQILKDIELNEAYSNLAINAYLGNHQVTNPAFIREIVYGVLRNQILIDYNIDKYVPSPQKVKTSDRIILRMGFYQLAKMNSVTVYAAVSESVNLAKRFAKGRDGFINAVLRNFVRDGRELKADILDIRYSCHPSIADLIIRCYGYDVAESLLKNSVKVPPLTTRVNKNGTISIQGLSSQKAVRMLNPKPGESILDLCAAPGGKSIFAADLMDNNGSILACDLHPHRVELIEKEALRTGAKIIKTRVMDSTVFCEEFRDKFDAVICDVPCTGLGTIAKKPEIKLRGIDRDYLKLYITQETIFGNAASYVKPGGRILYSTCTLNPSENEHQFVKFMAAHPNFERVYNETILPDGEYDGFYIGIVKRIS